MAQGWGIRAGSYFLIPFRQAFGADFPQDWTIFLSFKTDSSSQVGLGHLFIQQLITINDPVTRIILGGNFQSDGPGGKRGEPFSEHCGRLQVRKHKTNDFSFDK